MSLELAKSRLVRYQGPELLASYSEFTGQKRTTRTPVHVGTRRACQTRTPTSAFQFCVKASAATVIVWGFAQLEGTYFTAASSGCDLVSVDLETPQVLLSRPEPRQAEPQRAGGPVLEMKLPKRSLRDKSGEELSEFEREHPW